MSRHLLLRLLNSVAVLACTGWLHAQFPGEGGPPPNNDGPWNRDVIAYRVSASGAVEKAATFERAGVPTIARLKDGRLIVAHQHFPENDRENFDKVAVHFSSDDGKTWTAPQVIQVAGQPEGMRFPFDPTLVPLPDGRVRLYFTGNYGRTFQRSTPTIHSAISTDGVNYTYEQGVRFGVEGRAVIDCAVVLHQGVFHLFSPDNGAGPDPGRRRGSETAADRTRQGVGYHATSKDGLNFTRVADVQIEGRRSWLGNAQSDGRFITFYGTGEGMSIGGGGRPRGAFRMATSADGQNWKLVANPPIGGGDPGAVRMRDDGLLVVITGESRLRTSVGRDGATARGQPRSDNPSPQSDGPPERATHERWPLAQGFNTLAANIVGGKATADDKRQFKQLAEWLRNSGRGPWFDEVRVATSTDGLNFTDTRQTVLSKASVPEAVVDAQGNVWLFFVDGDLDQWVRRVEAGGPFKTGLMSLGAAKSADGLHFERVEMEIKNVNAGENVDPDIVVSSDGTYHLYYLGVPANELAADTPDPARAPGPHRFFLATSRDLVHWTQQGVAWTGPHGGADPAVYRLDAKTWFIIGGGTGRSDDGGKTFQQIQMTTGRWGQPDVVAVNGGFRAFHSTRNGIQSAFSKDGVTWTEEDGTRMPGGADPSVVRMKDGSWRMYYKVGAPPASQPRREQSGQRGPAGQIRVERVDSKYAVAPAGKPGRFVTGQDADIVLGAKGFNNTGGPLLFNHPTGLATDGKALLMTDRWNNRVLIWKSAPAKNVPPDLVLGQPDFTQNNPGTGMHQMNWPGNVAITPDGSRIAVTDTQNNRILIWNSFPTKNGAAADIALDLEQLSERGSPEPQQSRPRSQGGMRFGWPWGVWTDGKKLAVVTTHGSAVLIWNSLPTRDNQPPDLVLRPRNAGTPRNVTSDGNWFAVSDHNNGERSRPGTMVWRAFPTDAAQEPDFTWGEWLKGTFTPDHKLILAGIRSIYIWNEAPRDTETDAAVMLRPDSYRNGDGPDAIIAGGRLYVCNYNGNNVLAWNSLPARNNQPPDFALGSDTPEQDTWAENFFIQNPVVATDGRSLFVSSDFNRKMFVWRNLPDESTAKPDLVFHLPEAPWDNALHGATLALAGRQTVYVWKKLPLNGESPDVELSGRIGSVELHEITGVALDNRYFYLSDRQANAIYVWEGIPTRDSEPKFTLNVERPGRLSSDGTYFAAAPFEGQSINLWRIADLGPNARPTRLGGHGRFNLPGKCVVSHGHLFVADTSFHRVHVWHRVEDALAGHPADALLGAANDQERRPAIGRNQLFMPGTVAFGGGYLWVGEFKFSTRILRFSPQQK